jgi:hypothetical protein
MDAPRGRGRARRADIRRTWWLDFDGGGYTVKDRVTASPSTAWRLEMAPPLALGRVAVNGQDLPITRRTPDGPTGVELRDRVLDLDADARLDGATRRVPAVGWSSDFTSVSGVLNLPPGWRLFTRAASVAEPTWVAQWSPLDLFLVLVTAMAVLHLYGRLRAALARGADADVSSQSRRVAHGRATRRRSAPARAAPGACSRSFVVRLGCPCCWSRSSRRTRSARRGSRSILRGPAVGGRPRVHGLPNPRR